ncbi:MAG: formimidoylglutamase [Phycisphaerales bacterium]|nr:formimidoylglutamase [Phycisphaerales bacterium]
MARIAPHTLPPHWSEPAPGRFASLINGADPDGCRVALLGLPDDKGIALNRGRPGAAEGPAALRRLLAKYGAAFDAKRAQALSAHIFDAGDVEPHADSDPMIALERTHERVTEAAAALHERGLIVLGLGGGHDLTFPTARALAQYSRRPIGGINLDPHLDVRETLGSGMPFRSLIEDQHLDPTRFTELGVARFANAPEHVAYLQKRGGLIVLDDNFVRTEAEAVEAAFARAKGPDGKGAMFVSIDLDSLPASVAPGVSAPNPLGVPIDAALRLAERAGRDPCVKHFDIMELSPPHDIDGRTVRVAALLLLHFIAGVEVRP